MKALILGDTHCSWKALQNVIWRATMRHGYFTHIIQCGDWGYGWHGIQPFDINKPKLLSSDEMSLYTQAEKLFIDGNHENFDLLNADKGAWQTPWQYMPRGSIKQLGHLNALFFGGATTPAFDMQGRTQGVSWWPDESIKYSQVQKALEQERPIDIMFTHDHPASFPYRKYDTPCGNADRDFLEVLRYHFKPKWHFFGHHHNFKAGETDGTKWMCCPIIDSRQAIIFDGYEARLEQF